jgi:hypothetical protein
MMNSAILEVDLSILWGNSIASCFFLSLDTGMVGEGGKSLKNSVFKPILRKK